MVDQDALDKMISGDKEFEEKTSVKKKVKGLGRKAKDTAENQKLFLSEGGTGFEQPELFEDKDEEELEELSRDQRVAREELGGLF